jgi:hypothetical protein
MTSEDVIASPDILFIGLKRAGCDNFGGGV